MTNTQTRKKAQYTYAERVVGALNELQRGQRRRLVHLATLRAQVRKNAEHRDDPLGPQWTSWVKKAVHKLEERGVFESSAPNYVAFTFDAKKRISAAERANASASAPVVQEDIVKSVVRPAPSTPHGVKRRRRSSGRTAPPPMSDDDNDDQETTPIGPVARSVSANRLRRHGIAEISPATWTKAKLLSEFVALKQSCTNAAVQDDQTMSSLCEELDALRQELKEQRQLERSSAQDPGDAPTLDERLASGVLRPPASFLSTPNLSPIRRSSRAVMQNSASDAIRTEAGTLIDRLSKQCTPGPSLELEGEDHAEHFEDVEDRSIQDGDNVFGASHGLATPMTSPLHATPPSLYVDRRADQTYRELREARESHQGELRSLRQELDALVAEKSELIKLLAARDSVIQRTKKELANSNSQLTAIGAHLAKHEETITALQSTETGLRALLVTMEHELAARESKLVAVEATCTAQASTLASMEAGMVELKTQLVATEAKPSIASEDIAHSLVRSEDFVHEASDLRVSLDTLRIELDERNDTVAAKVATITALTETLSDLKHREVGLHTEVSALRDRVASLLEDVAEKNDLAEDLRAQLLASEKRLRSLEDDAASKDTTISELREAQDTADAHRSALASEVDVMKTKHRELQVILAEREHQLATKTSEANNLQSLLDASAQTRAELRESLVMIESQKEALTIQLASTSTQVSSLRAELSKAEAKQYQLERMIDQVGEERIATASAQQTALAEVEASLDTTRAELEGLRAMTADTQSQVAERDAQLFKMTSQRDADAEQVARITKDLQGANAAAARAAQEADELRAAKVQDEASIQAMKQILQFSLRAQFENLTRAEQQIASYSPSPMPNHRTCSASSVATLANVIGDSN